MCSIVETRMKAHEAGARDSDGREADPGVWVAFEAVFRRSVRVAIALAAPHVRELDSHLRVQPIQKSPLCAVQLAHTIAHAICGLIAHRRRHSIIAQQVATRLRLLHGVAANIHEEHLVFSCD